MIPMVTKPIGSVLWGLVLLWMAGSGWCDTEKAPDDSPILETYRLSHGGTLGGSPSGIIATLNDQQFGNGTARAAIQFGTRPNNAYLAMQVFRRVPTGHIVFALLVMRVEVRGFDNDGNLVYTRDMPGFIFGDSQSGVWTQQLRDLPATVYKIHITFVGNYA